MPVAITGHVSEAGMERSDTSVGCRSVFLFAIIFGDAGMAARSFQPLRWYEKQETVAFICKYIYICEITT